MQKFAKDHKEVHGRFKRIPEYTKENEAEDWENFRESFLRQKEKKQKLLDIISACKTDLPMLQDKITKDLRDVLSTSKFHQQFSKPQAFILGGSAVIGPRDTMKDPTSDIDIFLIMKDENFENGYYLRDHQIFDIPQSETGIKYQLIFVSENLKYLPSFLPIHILAQPHIILSSNYSAEETIAMTREVVDETVKNLPQIREKLSTLQIEQEEKKRQAIFE